MVTREYDGLAGAGGVKDVCRQLAETLVERGGCSVRVILPRYGFMDAKAFGFTPLHLPAGRRKATRPDPLSTIFYVDMNYPDEERREAVSIWEHRIKGVHVLLVEAERFAEKLGVYTYTTEEEEKKSWQIQGSGHFDYFAMNILLQKTALDLMILIDEHPDVIHCQDGHAATLPAMMRENSSYRHYFRESGAVVTVHNAGKGYHQELEDLAFAHAVTGLPEHVIRLGRLSKCFDPFVASAGYAVLNTVSENYAHELQGTREDARTGWLGHRLLRRGVKLAGITNGINPHDFDPLQPEKLGLAAAFDPLNGELNGKRICKETLLRYLGSKQQKTRVEQYGRPATECDLPLFTFIGRLTAQKGVDILLRSLGLLLDENADFQLLILGSGDPVLEKKLQLLTEMKETAGRLCFLKGYDPDLANKIYAAGDFFLIPSLYEPCGLTDYIAQLFGNLPIVHYVGGLVKVIDEETGFAYTEHTPVALAEAMERALATYRLQPENIPAMQKAAVKRIHEHHTWEKVMNDYFALYEQALEMTFQG
ncbi:MAG: glycosyltransferase [Desulfobulbaceae bacterium]|nr:glycosyltransferase [Desulfobulbaceae bacterium]